MYHVLFPCIFKATFKLFWKQGWTSSLWESLHVVQHCHKLKGLLTQ